MSTSVLVLLILLCLVLAIGGLVGTIIPVIPGAPLCWVSLLVAYYVFPPYVSATVLWVMLALTLASLAFDYVAPILLTKAGGGSKAATTGSTVGLLLGLFFMPVGLIVGPIIGAFLGELCQTNSMRSSLIVAMYSFLSFLLTTGMKLVLCLLMTFYVVKAIWQVLV